MHTPTHTNTLTHTRIEWSWHTAKADGRTHREVRMPSKGHKCFGASMVCGPLLAGELCLLRHPDPSIPDPSQWGLLGGGGSTLSQVPQVEQRPYRSRTKRQPAAIRRVGHGGALPSAQPSSLGAPSAAKAQRGSETAPATWELRMLAG